MKKRFITNSYNDLLFNGSLLRRFIHLSRFFWIKEIISKYQIKFSNVLELGCGDGKTLEFLSKENFGYYGLDANWNGGLDNAKEKYLNNKNINFEEIKSSKDISFNSKDLFDLFICMETLEHIPPADVCNYLEKISKFCSGYLLFTVPNEKGIFFLLKRIIKLNSDNYQYNLKEIINITLGRTNSVKRFQHKGFDYENIIYDINKFFRIIKVEGSPLGRFFPKSLCFNICIIAKVNE